MSETPCYEVGLSNGRYLIADGTVDDGFALLFGTNPGVTGMVEVALRHSKRALVRPEEIISIREL